MSFNGERHSIAELLRFAAVGVLGTGIYFLGTALLSRYGHLSVAVAASVSFVLVVTINYFLHHVWTFRSDKPHTSAAPRFAVTAVGGMIINATVLTLGARFRALPQTALMLLGVASVVAWNYLLSKFWVFMDRDSEHSRVSPRS